MKDFYEILGVSPNADIIVISAAYKALAKIYHPDKWKGDKKVGEKKIRNINEAYETLNNTEKREQYDKDYFSSNKNKNADFDDNTFSDEYAVYEDIIKDSWKFATEYYPKLEQLYNHLLKLSKKLAWQFQTYCIETKSFDDAEKIAKRLKQDWLNINFGKNKDIQYIALKAIEEKQGEIVKEVFRAINLLGDNSHKIIIEKLHEKFPEFFGINLSSLEIGYKGYEYIQLRYFSGGITWKITNAPQEASIGMEFDDEEKLKHYIDFKESL